MAPKTGQLSHFGVSTAVQKVARSYDASIAKYTEMLQGTRHRLQLIHNCVVGMSKDMLPVDATLHSKSDAFVDRNFIGLISCM